MAQGTRDLAQISNEMNRPGSNGARRVAFAQNFLMPAFQFVLGIAKPQEAGDILAASSAASFVTNAELARYLKEQPTVHRGADDQRMERENAV